MRKTAVVLSLILACAVAIALSGCKDTGGPDGQTGAAAAGSGPIRIAKMGGGIDVENAPLGASLTTMGGNIQLNNVASFAKVKTMGGNIAIDHANASIDATTMGGTIAIDNANGSIKATSMGGGITVRVVGSSSSPRDIDLTTMAGGVQLTVPRDFPMNVRINLAYTKDSAGKYRIVDDVGLTQSQTTDWDLLDGSPRKYIRASGVVGSGLNHVTINAINGNVVLKQENQPPD